MERRIHLEKWNSPRSPSAPGPGSSAAALGDPPEETVGELVSLQPKNSKIHRVN